MATQKQCSQCRLLKPVDGFHRDRHQKDGYYSMCKTCKHAKTMATPREVRNARARAWCARNRERSRELCRQSYRKNVEARRAGSFARNLRNAYGIGVDEYTAMCEAQSNLCAICDKPETSKSPRGDVKRLSVDHDHTTGKIRGLLCDNCNRGIGMLQEDVKNLRRAIEYLS